MIARPPNPQRQPQPKPSASAAEDPYAPGAAVEVYSNSQGQWLAATVKESSDDGQGGRTIKVGYESNGKAMEKTVRHGSELLRLPAAAADADDLHLSPADGTKTKKDRAPPQPEPTEEDVAADLNQSVEVGAGVGGVIPESLSGYWLASGETSADPQATELLILTFDADGSVTGVVDDGDGVVDEDDCVITNGSFDPVSGKLAFDQIYEAGTDDEEVTKWRARYDEGSDRFVKGKWSGATKGKWEAERSEAGQQPEADQQEQPEEEAVAEEEEEEEHGGDDEEKRIDAHDGGAYRKEEFVEHYG